MLWNKTAYIHIHICSYVIGGAAEQTDIVKAMIGSDLTMGVAYGHVYGCTGSNIQTDKHLHLCTYLKVTPLQGMIKTTTIQRINLERVKVFLPLKLKI